MNNHKDCKYYHANDDICLLFFELTRKAFNVSRNTNECLEKMIYGDDDE